MTTAGTAMVAVLGLFTGLWLVGAFSEPTGRPARQWRWALPVGYLMIVLALGLFLLAVPTISDAVAVPAPGGVTGPSADTVPAPSGATPFQGPD